jgi:ABC-type phosphate transport system substrate-binding protein
VNTRLRRTLHAVALAAAGHLLIPEAAASPGTPEADTPAVSAAAPARTHLAVIVNRNNPIGAIGRAELRALFLGERTTWTHGRRVTVILREPGQAERAAARRLIYGMSEADLTRHFLHQTFTGGTGAGPRTLATAENVKRFVFNVPGAIGVVRLADVDDTVKVIRINGVAPGEMGYGLVIGES